MEPLGDLADDLRQVQRQLDNLSDSRLAVPLRGEWGTLYKQLCEREEELLRA